MKWLFGYETRLDVQYWNIFVDHENTEEMSKKPSWLFRSIEITALRSAVFFPELEL